jgi:hypothetical protein
MRWLETFCLSMVLALGLTLAPSQEGRTEEPKPRAIPHGHREATAEQKPANNRTDQTSADGPTADALAIATPSGPTGSAPPASSTPKTTDEEHHWRIEEAHEVRSLQVEQRLVCLTAGLAVINAIVMGIYFFTMLATIRATKAATSSAASYSKQLALQARPLLRVRQAHLVTERPYIKASYVLVNAGGSIAHIISMRHALVVGTATATKFGIEPFDLEAGQKYHGEVQAGGSLLPDQILTSLKLIGLVIYTDENDIVRETSFDRLYRFDLHIFERAPNWDSEYED